MPSKSAVASPFALRSLAFPTRIFTLRWLVVFAFVGALLSMRPMLALAQQEREDPEEKKAAQAAKEEHEKDFEDGEKGESGEYIRKRQQWFHDQRAYPLKNIPAGIRQRAIKVRNQKMAAEAAARETIRGNGSATPLTSPTPPVWTLIGPQPIGNYYGVSAGRVTSLAVNPSNSSIVYAGGAEGGVWKTTNGGTSWTALTDAEPSLAVGSIAIDPTNVNTIYVGTGEENFSGDSYYGAGILKSTNAGATWTQYCGPFCGPESVNGYTDPGAYIGAIAVDPNNNQIVLCAVELYGAHGVYRSTNGGVTWTLVSTDGGIANAVFFDPVNAGVAYAASETAGILKSTNHGLTWTPQNGSGATSLPSPNGGRIALAIAPSSPLTLYAGIANPSTSQLAGFYKTTDGGNTWNLLPNATNYCGSQCWYDNVIGVSPTNPNLVFAGGSYAYSPGSSAALRSLDGGNTWSDQGPVHPDAHAMAFSADGTILYTGNDGGVWSTTNPSAATVAWTSLNPSLALAEFYPGLSMDQSNVNHSYGGTQDNGTNKYTGSLDWPTVDCGDGGSTAIDPANTKTVYTTCVGLSVDKSTNDGASFTSSINGISTSDHLPFIPTLTMDPENSQNLYFGTYRVWQTTDAAALWNPISGDLTKGDGYDNVVVMTVAPADSNTIYAGSSEGALSVTRNALSGASAAWTTLSGTASLPNRSITSIAVDPTKAATAYVGYSGFTGFGDSLGHIFMTTNAGASWTDISSDLPNTPVDAILVDPDSPQTIFIGTDIGAFYTSNSGASWSALGTGLPNVVVTGLGLHENTRTLRASTHGRSMWDLNIGSLLPVPSITTISPSSVPEGNPAFTLTVNGFQFATNSVVEFNGVALTTTYVSATQLTATVPAADVNIPGNPSITVYNPTTGKLSNYSTLSIYYIASTTTTTLTATPTSGAQGTSFKFVASVTDRSGAETGGAVSFFNGAELLATEHILMQAGPDGALGSAVYITRGLPIGSDSITAQFTGTALDSVSTSAPQVVTVSGHYATSTTLTSSGSQGSYGLTASVVGKGVGTPTGSVNFFDVSTGSSLGSGTLTGITTSYVSTLNVSTESGDNDVAVGDVNNDGIPDLVFAAYNGGTNWIQVALGNGDGTFATPQTVITTSGNGGPAVSLADLNGDGNLDIIGANWGGAGLAVFLGNGNGTFGAEQDYPVDSGYANSIATGDFNGDGKLDIVTSDPFGNSMSILLGNGDGTFLPEQHMATDTGPESIAVGDFNGDGKLDAVVANTTGTVSVFLGNGDGTFLSQPPATADSNGNYLGPRGIAVGDINSDGKLDIVVANWLGECVEILYGNGNGTFQTAQAFSGPGSTPSGVAVADVNGDGKPDIVTASYNFSVATVFLNNGNGTFTTNGYTVGNTAVSLALGDFNGDGIIDIASLDANDEAANILLGQTVFTSTISGITLPGVGSDQVNATYSGDTHFAASTSNTLTLTSNASAAAPPSFNPPAGTYTTAQSVVLSDSTGNATIYYTTNGTTPTTISPKYTTAIPVTATETIKAIATATGYGQSAVSSATYTISSQQQQAATPTFNPPAGTYTQTGSVTISDTTSGATIYYTTNGTTPTTSSTKYTSPVPLTASTTIQAIAVATGYTQSAVGTAVYTINLPTAATPTFNPPAGTYTQTGSVTISDTTPGATVYYTTNGTTPTTSSAVYSAPIPLTASTTIKAIAVAANYNQSAVGTAAYTINLSTAATPTFNPPAGTYTQTGSVTISDTTPGATIYYTTNGTTPTTSSTKYTSPVPLTASTTIEAIAVAANYTQSAVGSATYTINLSTAATPTFNPPAGTYTQTGSVTISDTTPGATIYYTTNGATPTTSSSVYSSPIPLTASTTIKAIAVAPSYSQSAVASATYTINLPTAATPTFNPPAGTYTQTGSVTISDTTPGATIYYTTNGTTPTTSSTKYTSPVPITATTTFEAIAVATNYTQSAVGTATYTINLPSPPQNAP
jgi:hypothetical protein